MFYLVLRSVHVLPECDKFLATVIARRSSYFLKFRSMTHCPSVSNK